MGEEIKNRVKQYFKRHFKRIVKVAILPITIL